MERGNVLKAALVGCGLISECWLKACQEFDDLRIVALVDIVEDNAKKKAAEFKLDDIVISDSLEDVLPRCDVDIVFDCTPLFTERFLMNRECVRQGKPMVEAAMYCMEGQVTTIIPGRTPCLACLYPEDPP